MPCLTSELPLRFLASLLAGLFVAGCATSQPPLAPPGLSRVERVSLGGQPQTIFIRTRNSANPVLLFLHGGPGIPEMPFSHVNAALERDFTVVHWDQLGAGKSYRPGLPPDRMTVENFVRQTGELTRHLRTRFRQPKIYLAGFSWGSLVGILAAAEHPEYYRAYIGISQLVDIPESELLLHRAGIRQAESRGYPRIARELREIGEPPYRLRRQEGRVNALTKEIQPPLPRALTLLREIGLFLESPYYSLGDILPLLRGIRFSGKALREGIYAIHLESQLPALDVPVWFFLGRHDTILSAPLAERYFRALDAPQGKHLVWFERSGHALQFEEPAKYRAEIRRVRQATALRN